jgi:hypothetical protein
MGERLSENCSRGTEVDIGTMYAALDLSNDAVGNIRVRRIQVY